MNDSNPENAVHTATEAVVKRYAWLLAGLLGTSASACSLFLGDSFGDPQCEQTSDCLDFPGTECVSNVCTTVQPSGPSSSSSGSGGGSGNGCVSNQQCYDENGGLAYICKNPNSGEECVPLLSEDCVELSPYSGDFRNDNAIFFGFMHYLTGATSFIGKSQGNAIELALKEFKDNYPAGIPGPGGVNRPLVMVRCDAAVDPIRAAKHLVDDLGVVGILGPQWNEHMLPVMQEVTVNANVLTICGPCGNPQIANYPDQGLQWGTIPNDKQVMQVYDAFVDKLAIDLGNPSPLRVAILTTEDATDTAMADEAEGYLSFNGKSAAANFNDGNYLRKTYANPILEDPDYGDVAVDVNAFAPHIIVGLVNQDHNLLVEAIELGWTNPQDGPTYLFFYGADPVLALAAADDNLRHRLFSTDFIRGGELFDTYKIRYQALWDAPSLTNVHFLYDSAYVFFYSYLANNNWNRPTRTLTGTDLANAILSMNPGTGHLPKNVTPSEIVDTGDAFVGGADIDLTGVSGPLDFDPEIGHPLTDIDLRCVNSDGTAAAWGSAGVIYDAETKQVVPTDPPVSCN